MPRFLLWQLKKTVRVLARVPHSCQWLYRMLKIPTKPQVSPAELGCYPTGPTLHTEATGLPNRPKPRN